MQNRIIIIGGMGPQASIELHRRLIARAAQNGATSGKDFPEIAHLSLPIDDFISDKRKTARALNQIRNALDCFYYRSWRPCGHSLQHGASAVT